MWEETLAKVLSSSRKVTGKSRKVLEKFRESSGNPREVPDSEEIPRNFRKKVQENGLALQFWQKQSSGNSGGVPEVPGRFRKFRGVPGKLLGKFLEDSGKFPEEVLTVILCIVSVHEFILNFPGSVGSLGGWPWPALCGNPESGSFRVFARGLTSHGIGGWRGIDQELTNF